MQQAFPRNHELAALARDLVAQHFHSAHERAVVPAAVGPQRLAIDVLLLAGAVMLLVNIFVMTFKWKIGLGKAAFAAVTAPLESSEVKS